MLSYTLAQAEELLTGKLSSAEQNFTNVTEDLEFLREQITIMEVNTARVSVMPSYYLDLFSDEDLFYSGVQLGCEETAVKAGGRGSWKGDRSITELPAVRERLRSVCYAPLGLSHIHQYERSEDKFTRRISFEFSNNR